MAGWLRGAVSKGWRLSGARRTRRRAKFDRKRGPCVRPARCGARGTGHGMFMLHPRIDGQLPVGMAMGVGEARMIRSHRHSQQRPAHPCHSMGICTILFIPPPTRRPRTQAAEKKWLFLTDNVIPLRGRDP